MNMEKKRLHKVFALIAVMALVVSLLSGCAGKSLQTQQDDETIQVYLWTTGPVREVRPLCAGTAAGCKH